MAIELSTPQLSAAALAAASAAVATPADAGQATDGTTGGDGTAAAAVPFADLATGTEPLPLDYDLALLSLDVGNAEPGDPADLNGWSRCTTLPPGVELPEGGSMDADGRIYGPGGVQCAIYQRGDDYVLVFAGSGVTGTGDQPATVYITTTTGEWVPIEVPGGVVGTAEDWITNGGNAVGHCPAQYVFAMQLAGSLVDAYPGRVLLSGHSLGGGLASAASIATGAPAVTFNAAGPGSGTIDYAVDMRIARDGEGRDEDDYLAEAEAGGIRAYRTGNDLLTLVQDGDSPQLPGDLPPAIGHPIVVSDPAWSPVPGLFDSAFEVLGNLLLAGHMMDSVEGGVFVATQPVVAIKGMTVTVLEPPDSADPLSAAGTEQRVVTFADSPQGREAMRVFLVTGELPADMAGVTRVETTGLVSGDRSMTTTTHYGEAGLPVAGKTVVYDDGVPVVTVSSAYDAAGEELVDRRTYTYCLVPADATEAATLNVLFGHDPETGPFQPGQPMTVTLDHAQMAALEADAVAVPGGGDVNLLAEGDGDAGAFDATTDFALDLAGSGASGFAALLWALRSHAGKTAEPVPATVAPAE